MRKKILITSLGYNIETVIKKIKNEYPKTKFYVFSEVKINLLKILYYKLLYNIEFIILDKLENESVPLDFSYITKLLIKNLNYNGINYHSLVSKKISDGIYPSVQKLETLSKSIEKTIKNLKPTLVLSVLSRGISKSVGEICRKNNINAMCISHGTVVPPKNELEEIVNKNIGKQVILNEYPAVAIQTPWAKEFFKYYKTNSEKIITGPLVLSKVNKTKGSKIKILHATTFKNKSNTKFWGVETADEYLDGLMDLINVFRGRNNYELCVKLHPSFFFQANINDLKCLLDPPDNVTLSRSKVSNELKNTDILISYSSTVIEEALINKIPVILYDKWNRYMHYNCINLEKEEFRPSTMYYVNSANTISRNMDDILISNKDYSLNWSKHDYVNIDELQFNTYLKKVFN